MLQVLRGMHIFADYYTRIQLFFQFTAFLVWFTASVIVTKHGCCVGRGIKFIEMWAFVSAISFTRSLPLFSTFFPLFRILSLKRWWMVLWSGKVYWCRILNITLPNRWPVAKCLSDLADLTFVWLGGVVVRALDLRLKGRGFKSQPLHCWVQLWTSCSHTFSSAYGVTTLWRYINQFNKNKKNLARVNGKNS